MMLELCGLIVVAVLAYFYPSYAASLPVHPPMGDSEAHWLSLWLLVSGGVFLVVTHRLEAKETDVDAARPTGGAGGVLARPSEPHPFD